MFRVSNATFGLKNVGGPGARWQAGGPSTKPPPSFQSAESVNMNQRYHVALMAGPEGTSFSVDGVLQGRPLHIMSSGKETSLYVCKPDPMWHKAVFHGDIDEIRVSSVVRYREAFTPKPRFEPDADTLALYHCDEGEGDVVRDASANGRHAKMSGAKWVPTDPAAGK